MNKNERIQKTIESLGLERKVEFTIGELERISSEAKCSMHDTMRYLRYGRRGAGRK